MKKKLGEYLAALAVMAFILTLLLFIVNLFEDKTPEVGLVYISCGENSQTPLQNEIYRTTGGDRVYTKALEPEYAFENAPALRYSDGLSVSYEGGSSGNGDFYFTVYDSELNVLSERTESFSPVSEKGVYLLCFEAYWGTEDDNIGMEYYIRLEVQ